MQKVLGYRVIVRYAGSNDEWRQTNIFEVVETHACDSMRTLQQNLGELFEVSVLCVAME